MPILGRIINELIERDADKYFTKKVREFKGKIVGTNENSELYGELHDVNGFRFLNFKILGPLNVHVYRGCKLYFEGGSQTLEIESDSQEIFSDRSKTLGIGFTSIDIDLEGVEEKLRAGNFNHLKFQLEKTVIVFNIDTPAFIDALDTPVDPDDTEMGNENMDPFLQG